MTSKPQGLTRRGALGAVATLAAAKSLLPSGAFAAGSGPEVAKARLGFIALTDASPLIVANDFFAASPVRHLLVTFTGWRERVVRLGMDGFEPAPGEPTRSMLCRPSAAGQKRDSTSIVPAVIRQPGIVAPP